MRWFCAAILASELLAGCGGTSPPPLRLNEVFGSARVAVARREAPDLYARAELARREAERAQARGDREAAQDHATRARLLLEAAIVEAERIALEGERLEALRIADEAATAAAAAEQARHELERERVHARAAALARAQMQEAWAQAAQEEARRFRRRSAELTAARRRAALALRDRARLVLAAARALGADAAQVEQVAATLPRPDGDPAQALEQAEQAYRAALAVLGAARATHPVDEAVRASFLADAREHGFDAELRPEAAVLSLPRRPTTAQLRALAALTAAYPHGPLRLRGPSASSLRARLVTAGVPSERLEVVRGSQKLELALPAYGAPR